MITIDHLGKFEEKSDEGFLVRYFLNRKAFRVYNLDKKRVEENLHINLLENKPNVAGKGPTWLFDLDYLTNLMNYQPVTLENKANKTACLKEGNNSASTKDNLDAGNSHMEAGHVPEYFVLPLWSSYTSTVKCLKENNGDEKLNEDIGSKTNKEPVDQEDQAFLEELKRLKQQAKEADEAAKTLRKTFSQCTEDLLLQVGAAKASSTNYVNTASTLVNTDGIIVTTSSPARNIPSLEDIYEVLNDEIFKSASYDDEGAVADFTNLESTVNGHRQDEGIDYNEVLAPVARLEAIRIFLAFASYMGFKVYQMDVKSAFLYGKIDEEVYVSQPSGFIDPKFAKKVYKVVKALYGLHQVPKAWYTTFSTFLVKSGYKRGIIDNSLFIKKDQKDIMLVSSLCLFLVSGHSKDFTSLSCEEDLKCKKQTIVATSATEAEYVAAANYCEQVLWIQNQLLDYDFNFMNTKIYFDNESTICIVKSLVFYSKTKHIEIRHHFIKDAYEKKLIQNAQPIAALVQGRKDGRQHLGEEHVSKQGEDKKAKTRLNIKEGNFNKLDDLVGEGADYVVNKERSTNKIKVLNAKEEGVSAAGKTLSTATLVVSIVGV
nr:putative ribonuclease H-like domain-containing protein [Tanacetum cinerariifolium]